MRRDGATPEPFEGVTRDGGGAGWTAGRVGDYEQLTGGEGRGVHFRPERHRRASWAPLSVAVSASAGADIAIDGGVVDLSQNGAAFLWPEHVPVSVGQELNDLVVSFDGREAYRGSARVASVRRGASTIVGVALIDGGIDIASWLQVRSVRVWADDIERVPDGAGGVGTRVGWSVTGHERFKAGVASLRLLLEDIEEMLAGLDDSLSPPIGRHVRAQRVNAALEEQIRRQIVPAVLALSREIDDALRAARTKAEHAALGDFSRRCLQEILMCAPWMCRAREKPLGYPGDFGVMSFIYGASFSGPTLFARALSLAFACTPGGEAVRARKDLIKAQLSACLDRPSDRPLRILSIASGPAQEIVELLDERPPPSMPVEIVLFDQDQRALAHAGARIGRAARWNSGSKRVDVRYLHDAIRPLLRGAGALAGQGPFDVIYACGLLDYLQTRTAVSLCRSLYGLLAPGGTLYAGNMVPSNPSRWFMELHLDWFLIYREIEELLQIGRAAAPDAELRLLEEATGVNPFLVLRRDG